jgi:hypothetical protein
VAGLGRTIAFRRVAIVAVLCCAVLGLGPSQLALAAGQAGTAGQAGAAGQAGGGGEASGAEGLNGKSLSELTNAPETQTTATTTSTKTTESNGSTSRTLILLALGAAVVLLSAIGFVIVRDARRVAPAGEGDIGTSRPGRDPAAQLRKRRAKAKAARQARKRNR